MASNTFTASQQHKALRDARRVCEEFMQCKKYTIADLCKFQEAHDLLESFNYKKRAEIPIELVMHAKSTICKNLDKNLYDLQLHELEEHNACLDLLAKLRNEKPLLQRNTTYDFVF